MLGYTVGSREKYYQAPTALDRDLSSHPTVHSLDQSITNAVNSLAQSRDYYLYINCAPIDLAYNSSQRSPPICGGHLAQLKNYFRLRVES